MNLRVIVETLLKDERRTFDWLASEMDMTPQGLRGSLAKETLKYKDIKKLARLLNQQITVLFEGNNTTQKVKGNNNKLINHSQVQENEIYRKENEQLRKMIEVLESQLKDKEHIIELLRNKQ